MKWLWAFILAALFSLRAEAQNAFPDMAFRMDFTQVEGTITNINWGGTAKYNRLITNYPAQKYTNDLEIIIDVPSKPDSARLVATNTDGNLREMAKLTNFTDYISLGRATDIMEQHIRLTKSQIHTLVEGDWYVELTFGGAKYVANLNPQYNYAGGPSVDIESLSPVLQKSLISGGPISLILYDIVAKDSRTADVFFSAAKTTDPFYLPIQYEWIVYDADASVTTNTPVATNTTSKLAYSFGLGWHAVTLQASDPIVNREPIYVIVNILTPSQAVDVLKFGVMRLPQNQYNRLMQRLSKASLYFDQGNLKWGSLELIGFIQQVENLHHHDQATLWTLQCSKGLLESLYWPDSEIKLLEQ